jgi:soluble lytic murein transglycosylase-like protein
VRRNFLAARPEQQAFSLEISKEAFFRSHVPYGSIIYREARRNHLAPELVAAVVESESDFRPRLLSNKNAQGLMQIVPETGRLMGAENLFNPEENIAAGTKYLRYLFDRFGDEKIVLAAYNAGEGNIERFGGVPPFQETLNYLQRVAQRRRDYTQRVHGNFVAVSQLQKSLAE